MTPSLPQRTVARVLFDEAHQQAWSIRPDLARRMQPQRPQDSSYATVAGLLAERDFDVTVHAAGPLTESVLAGADVLVIAHPSDPKWERTTGEGEPVHGPDELEAIARFVARGGGLLVLGETEQEKYGSNLNELLGRFGIAIENTTVWDYERHVDTPSWVLGEPARAAGAPNLLHRVDGTGFYRAGTLTAEDADAILLRTSADAQPPAAGLLAAVEHGDGRVVAVADSDLFGDEFAGRLGNAQLWLNSLYWLAASAFRAEPLELPSDAVADPAWTSLRDEVDAMRLRQRPDASIDLAEHDAGELTAAVERIAAAVAELAPRFPHQTAYLERMREDLAAWAGGGFAVPDFTRSLAAFHPEANRRDGIEHLVVFPMYTPNGSQDRRFEALIVRTPWPEFVAELERERYDNAKFVPVQLVDHTAGYASECAVLFPETVCVAGRPTNSFGAIFCDREAARFQHTVSEAADLLRIDLPPDAETLISSDDLMRETYILWDLIHDRWHSHGDLPFDPFMIRQRLPYWMYSLEELRVDLATFGDAGTLAREGFAFARYVQYAILFDRILRFPITGNRVRNYDGLGGQLLFAFLHRQGIVRWSDNRLVIDWERVEEGVAALRDQVDDLYRRGIDMSKVSYWMAAHDLVAEYVQPNVASAWRRDERVVTDEADPRAWIDRVLNDEFPLSLFYQSLKTKLEPEPARV